MTKRLLALLLMLALLLGAASCLAEQTPGFSPEKINVLRKLAGENGAPWKEGVPPTTDMDAFQMWQWTDWFLSNQVRSLMGTVQAYDRLDSHNTLDPGTEEVQWMLLEIESTLSHFETQLEEDRLAILNGISLYQSSGVSEADRLNAVSRVLEAESEIRQIIKTICGNYQSYLARMNECRIRLENQNAESMLEQHREELAKAASHLENIENATNASFDISVISRHQFRIQVKVSDKEPIKGALVTVTNQKNTSKTLTLPTDEHGNAVFWVSDLGADEKDELQLSLRITAGSFRTREVKTLKLHGGETTTFYMEKNDGTPYLVMGCFNGRDILSEQNTFYYSPQNDLTHVFSAKVSSAADGTLKVCYLKDKEEIVIASKSFKASDSDKTVFEFQDTWLSKLKPGTEVYFKIVTNDKKEYVFDTQLDIQKAVVEQPFLSSDSTLFKVFGAAGGFGFDIPDDIPFIGGSKLSVNIPGKHPKFMILPSGRAMFSWGTDFKSEQLSWKSEDSQERAKAIKEFEAKSAADKLLAKAGAYRGVNTTTESKMLGSFGAQVSPFVSLQGAYDALEHDLSLEGDLGATLAFKGGFTQTFTIGPVPFFAGVDFTMSASFGLSAKVHMGMDLSRGVLAVLEAPEIEYVDTDGSGLSISIRLELGGTIGIGLQDIASVALRGYGYLNPVVNFVTPKVTANATVGMGMGVTVRVLFLKWQHTIWSGKIDLSQTNSAAALNAPPEGVYKHFDNTGATMPLPPATNSVINGKSGVEPTSIKQVFSQIDSATGDFQYAVIGGQTYVFWIQPGAKKNQARLNWYNLTDTRKHGEITWPTGTTCNRQEFADYDFAVEVSRGLNNQPSSFCALTILSGKFFGTSSGETPEAPDQSVMATVLMKQNGDKGLEIVYYREHHKVFWKDNYATMPEVFLTAVNDSTKSVYLVSTCTSSDGQRDIYGQIVYNKDPSYKPGLDGLQELEPTSFRDGYSIARYHVGIPDIAKKTEWMDEKVSIYSLNRNSDTGSSELSRLSYDNRQLLASGDIINFRVYSQIEGTIAKDRLFYLDRIKQADGQYIHRLKCVTLDLTNLSAPPVKTDYGVEISAERFDIVKFGTGVYLYWTECSTPEAKSGAKEEYMVRCLRYDPGTDTVCGPFNMVKLPQSPNSIKLQDSGTGFYSVDLQNSQGSYLRQSFSQFTYKLVSTAELTAATPTNPGVCAGDYAEIVFSVKNTGNVPLSGINVKLSDGDKALQTLHIDCTNPNNNSNAMGERVMNGAYTVSRISGIYDPLNQNSWEIVQTNSNGTTTVRKVTTTMLMPGDTHCYKAKMLVPSDWEGDKTLTAIISSVEGDMVLNGAMSNGVLRLTGASQARNDVNDLSIMISRPSTGVQLLNTDVHDLSLSAQLFKLNGEDYVHVSIMNLSGNTASNVTPILTASYRGETLFSHQFISAMGDDFGYSMDIPLMTLTRGRRLQDLDLYVSTARDYDEFVNADNHVRLQLMVRLCIVDQPESILASAGKFSVTAAGGEKPYRYQWQRMTGANRWEDIPGACQDTYFTPKDEKNSMTVRCVVTDQFGDSVTSDSATLTILPHTGDGSQLTLWLLLALLSMAVLAMMYRKGRCR